MGPATNPTMPDAVRLRDDVAEGVARIAADPRFPGAALRFCETVPAAWVRLEASGLPINDAGGFAFAALLIVGHGHATEATLTRAMASAVLASRDRVRALIDRFEQMGHLVRASIGHGRESRLAATPALAGALRGWLQTLAAPGLPWHAIGIDRIDDPATARYLALQVEAAARGFLLYQGYPAVAALMHRRAGYGLLLLLLRLSLKSRASPHPFSRARFARQSGVSRAHVTALLRWCEAQGMLRRAGQNAIAIDTVFLDELRCWVAAELFWTGRCLMAAIPPVRPVNPRRTRTG